MVTIRRIIVGSAPPPRELLEPMTIAMAGVALGIAYFSAPFLRFVGLRTFMLAGFIGVSGVTLAQVGIVMRNQLAWTLARWLFWVSVANLLVLGVIAFRSARANDQRCMMLQRDMLSAHPRRADGPAVFGALGCRPQGEAATIVDLA